MAGATTTVISDPPALPAGKKVSPLIERYIQLRDKVKEIAEAHKKQLTPYAEAMEKLEGILLSMLHEAGVDSMKSMHGTVCKSTQTSVSVKEWRETLAYIQSHQLWDLLEARVSKTAAIERIQETGATIPGVSISQVETLRVRRS
jgi:hypothetical protein